MIKHSVIWHNSKQKEVYCVALIFQVDRTCSPEKSCLLLVLKSWPQEKVTISTIKKVSILWFVEIVTKLCLIQDHKSKSLRKYPTIIIILKILFPQCSKAKKKVPLRFFPSKEMLLCGTDSYMSAFLNTNFQAKAQLLSIQVIPMTSTYNNLLSFMLTILTVTLYLEWLSKKVFKKINKRLPL